MDAEEEGDYPKRPRILGLIVVLVEGPGWGDGALVDWIEHVCIPAWSFMSNLLVNPLLCVCQINIPVD